MSFSDRPSYLQPYTDAARRYGGGFSSLLWASPKTQRARFNALARLERFDSRFVLDVGCGRSDLLDYLRRDGQEPARYIGIEAVPALAAAARDRAMSHRNIQIIERDFVREPEAMNLGPQVIVFSGSLNTLEADAFDDAIGHAFNAATESVVFNFLSSPLLAGQPFLYWHAPGDVAAFARRFCRDVRLIDDYLDGDCTMALRKGVRQP